MVTPAIALSWEHYTNMENLFWTSSLPLAEAVFESGTSALERKNGPPESHYLRTIAALWEKLQRKNEVVAELMEEHIQPKKELGEL